MCDCMLATALHSCSLFQCLQSACIRIISVVPKHIRMHNQIIFLVQYDNIVSLLLYFHQFRFVYSICFGADVCLFFMFFFSFYCISFSTISHWYSVLLPFDITMNDSLCIQITSHKLASRATHNVTYSNGKFIFVFSIFFFVYSLSPSILSNEIE